jgi:thiol:disulfide interchange protein DsbD
MKRYVYVPIQAQTAFPIVATSPRLGRDSTLNKWLISSTYAGLILKFLVITLLLGLSSSIFANPVATENVQARLISKITAVKPGQSFWVALHLKMRDGWHTYWRNPGDSGLATSIKWTLPEGFQASAIHWPYPEPISLGPLMNYGYHGDVYLLVQLTPSNRELKKHETLTFRADANWLVCEENCIPESATLNLTLPITNDEPPLDERWRSVFTEARHALPKPSPWQTYFSYAPNQLKLYLDIPQVDASQQTIRFFPFQDGVIENAAQQTSKTTQEKTIVSLEPGATGTNLSRLQGVIVVQEHLDDGSVTQGFTVDALPISAQPAPNYSAVSSASMSYGILLAVVGGLMLNLMPCVFPILSIKALHFAQLAHDNPWAVRRHGLIFSAGVMVSFACIAGLLLGLRTGGAEIGWGFQLQSPLFITLLAYLFFILALSLSGLLVIGNSLTSIGQSLTTRSGYSGVFATGVLATLVATPCTAPFMGTALGYALTQPWPVALSIFQALGLGFALPYLTLSFQPSLLCFLPKPGPWMERFKEFLAFPLYGTVAWLVWVLSQQTGSDGVAAVLTGLIFIAFAAWLRKIIGTGALGWRLMGRLGILTVLIAALAVATLPTNTESFTSQPSSSHAIETAWEPFSKARLSALRAADRPVFVNFTAAWCITCLVNERVALSSPRVKASLAAQGITYLKADWTNRDPTITEMLTSFERSGVPLYVLYPSGRRSSPIILPQILTESLVLKAIQGLQDSDPT